MKVVLLQKVKGLGDLDDIKEVSEGYARNFLFPRNLAVLASEKYVKDALGHKSKKAKDLEKDLVATQKLADRLDGFHLIMEEKANEAGFLYAAVGQQKISEALKTAGFEVTKTKIITEPIKNLGVYQIKIKLGHSPEVVIKAIINAK